MIRLISKVKSLHSNMAAAKKQIFRPTADLTSLINDRFILEEKVWKKLARFKIAEYSVPSLTEIKMFFIQLL